MLNFYRATQLQLLANVINLLTHAFFYFLFVALTALFLIDFKFYTIEALRPHYSSDLVIDLFERVTADRAHRVVSRLLQAWLCTYDLLDNRKARVVASICIVALLTRRAGLVPQN